MKKILLSFVEIVEIFVICFFAVFLIRHFLVQPFLVSGQSMYPTFKNGNYILTDELSYRFEKPKRGDVIVFRPPVAGSFFIKRIIGLPGEEVIIKEGSVFIKKDNKIIKLKEKYLPSSVKTYPDLTVDLKKDQYFVLGDNRKRSYDSRFWGPIKKEDIVGKVKFRLWPPTALASF